VQCGLTVEPVLSGLQPTTQYVTQLSTERSICKLKEANRYQLILMPLSLTSMGSAAILTKHDAQNVSMSMRRTGS
jgi:hypothetical protein